MCGICGIYQFDREHRVSQPQLQSMADSLRHRGPDDAGIFLDENLGFAHRRLSIIDLTPSGHQPMTLNGERFWIVYNGEIYNYLELRQQLVSRGRSFHSSSDTEVILHLYAEQGPECVHQLNGMFAFVIWDRQERTLFAARDRFGIKPLYYVHNPHTFAFASEIKTLLKAGLVQAEVDPEGLADYLTFQFCLGEKTLFRHVHKLLPGHSLFLRPDGTKTLYKYWDLDFNVDTDHTEGYFQTHLLQLLNDAVRIQMRADVPVGAHLSGGLDSSTVTSLAASFLQGPIHTFSGGFREGPQYDETPYARLVAQHCGTQHHEVFPTQADFIDIMPRLIYFMDEPSAGPGLFPQYYVSRAAQKHVKVVLGGQGGDEIFGGYTRYLVAYLEECIRGGIQGTQEDQQYVVTFQSILPNLVQLQGYEPLLSSFWKEGLFEPPHLRYFRLIDRSAGLRSVLTSDALRCNNGYQPIEAYEGIFNEGDLGSYINKMTRFDLRTLLPALLQVEDRTSMAVSLESRVPLLDHRIAELVASMPPMIKYKGGRSKDIFRQVVQHIVPEAVNQRKDKMGFPVPLSEWVLQGPVREFVHETLLSGRARQRGLFRPEKVAELLDSEQAFGRGIWGLMCLELWMRTFIDG